MSAVDKKQKIMLTATSNGWKATNIPGIGGGKIGATKGGLGRKVKEKVDILAARGGKGKGGKGKGGKGKGGK